MNIGDVNILLKEHLIMDGTTAGTQPSPTKPRKVRKHSSMEPWWAPNILL